MIIELVCFFLAVIFLFEVDVSIPPKAVDEIKKKRCVHLTSAFNTGVYGFISSGALAAAEVLEVFSFLLGFLVGGRN